MQLGENLVDVTARQPPFRMWGPTDVSGSETAGTLVVLPLLTGAGLVETSHAMQLQTSNMKDNSEICQCHAFQTLHTSFERSVVAVLILLKRLCHD